MTTPKQPDSFAPHALLALVGLAASTNACAEFLEDSRASLEMRNFYFNRDFRQDGVAQNKAEEWAQGFLLRYESGFTEGPVGVGVDALGLLGVKLDSSPDRTGTGLLKSDREKPNRAQDEYGELGLTAKLRASSSLLKIGTLQPKLPIALANDSRLLPQTFRGAWLSSAEVRDLTLDLGRFDRINLRNSSDNEAMQVFNGGARNIVLGGSKTSDALDFAGASYRWTSALSTSYHYGELDGIYRQHYLTLGHSLDLGAAGSIKSDLRWARSLEDGGSNVDNRALGAMLTYKRGPQSFGLGYQRMSGDTGFAYVNGADAYLVNLVQINDFGNEDERSWQARYDFDFATLGVPGLTFMTRYLSGDDVEVAGRVEEGKEWERDTDIAYVIQGGPLKNLGLKWRNASTRSDFGSDIDENRLIVTYTLALW
ncbi:Porin-like protein NicP precursor [compost metagenome]